jgi:hypothetical protein
MKKIKFTPLNEKTKLLELAPIPSKRVISDWYRKTPKYTSKNKNSNKELDFAKDDLVATYKTCSPFTDAMTSGYTLMLSSTIYVIQEVSEGIKYPRLKWNVDTNLVDQIDPLVMKHFHTPYGYNSLGFRWINNWKIQTPKNYSLLATHPVNRTDLPFHTITGIVDTDKHPNPIIFPFFIREGFEGKIEAGTPIVQVLPIKRESWHSKIDNSYCNENTKELVKQDFIGTYKKRFWTRKKYY